MSFDEFFIISESRSTSTLAGKASSTVVPETLSSAAFDSLLPEQESITGKMAAIAIILRINFMADSVLKS